MKFQYSEGCTRNSLTVNGKETADMPVEEVRKAAHVLIDYTDSLSDLQEVLIQILCTHGEYKDLGWCMTCGDHNEEYTLEVEDK